MAPRRRAARALRVPPAAESPTLETLPDSVLTSILLTLPLDERLRFGAVSRRFAQLLRTPEPLAVLDFRALRTRGRCDDAALARLCRHAGPALRCVDIADAPAAARVTVAGLIAALRPCRGLQRLLTWRPPPGDAQLGDTCPNPAPAEPGLALCITEAAILHACCPLLGADSAITVVCAPASALAALRACPGPRLHLALIGANTAERRLPGNAAALAEAVAAATGLEVLAAPHIDLGDAGAAQLAAALVHAPSLRRLELNRNRLGDAGAAALGQLPLSSVAAGRAPALRALTLRHNRIGDAGVTALAMSALTSLHLLDLQDNAVGAAGAVALAGAMERGSPLRHLDLRRNRVTSQGARAFVDALRAQEAPALRVLNLAYNALGTGGNDVARAATELFRDAAGDGLRLRLLCLSGNGCAADAIDELEAACAAHWLRLRGETPETGWE